MGIFFPLIKKKMARKNLNQQNKVEKLVFDIWIIFFVIVSGKKFLYFIKY